MSNSSAAKTNILPEGPGYRPGEKTRPLARREARSLPSLLVAVVLALFLLLPPAAPAHASNSPMGTRCPLTQKDASKTEAFHLPADKCGNIPCIPRKRLQPTFDRASKKMEALKDDKVRNRWRQPWEELRNTFFSVYQSKTDGALAPQALHKAGECQMALAYASHLGEDARLAIGIFEAVANEYPQSDQASLALYAATKIAAERLHDKRLANRYALTIRNKYPESDEAKKTEALLASLGPAGKDAGKAKGKTDSDRKDTPARLENMSWDSPGKDEVEIVLDFSAPVKFSTRVVREKGKAPCIDMNIYGASVVSEIKRGVSIRGSLLQKIHVRTVSKGNTHVFFDFGRVRHFSTRKERNSTRVVLRVDALKKRAPDEGASYASRSRRKSTGTLAAMASSVASTGLKTVTIDAGHGGKDPGTHHNSILERSITLDVAMRLGKLLRDNGMRVIYTRKSNVFVPLAKRTRKANENRSDIFVSIHVNAHAQEKTRGFETYFLDASSRESILKVAARENGTPSTRARRAKVSKAALTSRVLESRRLAVDIQRRTVSRVRGKGLSIASNGVKSGPFYVLGTAEMPAVLAEIGYCTNKKDARLLASPAYRQAIAEGIAEGILAYRDRSRNRMTADTTGTGNRKAVR